MDDVAPPLAFLDAAPRADGIVVVRDAMPAAIAEKVASQLRSAPESAWKILTPNKEHVSAIKRSYERQGVQAGVSKMSLQQMRYSRLLEDYVGVDRASCARAVGAALRLQPFERIIMNFARYRADDYLDSHTDHPSGNAAYERHRAFVWHLTAKEWADCDGGHFVDEKTGDKYAPVYNALVHFQVPRYHRVEPVASHVRGARYSVYGWVITARVRPVDTVDELDRVKRECGGRATVIGWFGEGDVLRSPTARSCAQELALACLGLVGIDRLRGEDSVFCIATSRGVAHALDLVGEHGASGVVAVVRWEAGTADVVRLPLPGGVAALGTVLDAHTGNTRLGGQKGDTDRQVEHVIEDLVDQMLTQYHVVDSSKPKGGVGEAAMT